MFYDIRSVFRVKLNEFSNSMTEKDQDEYIDFFYEQVDNNEEMGSFLHWLEILSFEQTQKKFLTSDQNDLESKNENKKQEEEKKQESEKDEYESDVESIIDERDLYQKDSDSDQGDQQVGGFDYRLGQSL